MCKIKSTKIELAVWLCISALVGLTVFLLPARSANAATLDNCLAELAAGAAVTPTVAHIGDTVTIQRVNAAVPVLDCDEAEVSEKIVLPDGTTFLVFTGGVIPSGACFSCPINAACVGTGTCEPAFSSVTYVVAAPDIGKALT